MTDFEGSFAPNSDHYFNVVNKDVCGSEQKGIFNTAKTQFIGRGNFTYCDSISNGILHQGYLPSVLHFL